LFQKAAPARGTPTPSKAVDVKDKKETTKRRGFPLRKKTIEKAFASKRRQGLIRGRGEIKKKISTSLARTGSQRGGIGDFPKKTDTVAHFGERRHNSEAEKKKKKKKFTPSSREAGKRVKKSKTRDRKKTCDNREEAKTPTPQPTHPKNPQNPKNPPTKPRPRQGKKRREKEFLPREGRGGRGGLQKKKKSVHGPAKRGKNDSMEGGPGIVAKKKSSTGTGPPRQEDPGAKKREAHHRKPNWEGWLVGKTVI